MNAVRESKKMPMIIGIIANGTIYTLDIFCSTMMDSATGKKTIKAKKSEWIMEGFTDADWDEYIKSLEAYGLEDYLAIFQKYLDSFYENAE